MKILNQNQFFSFLDSLIKNYEFFAPLKKERINFEKISKTKDIFFDYIVTDNNSSDIVFPKRETLFCFQKEGGKIDLKENDPEIRKSIIFGARPCDAAALTKLDKVFNWDNLKDDYYNKRRENTIVVGIACNKAADTCFCTSVNVNPHQKENMDVMVYFLQKGGKRSYIIEIISKKGEELSKFIKGKSFTNIKELKKLEQQTIALIKHKFNSKELESKLDKVFNHTDFWKEQTNKCLRCGVCAMVCPTCYCFDMVDGKNERCRFWDACTLKMFTKQASGFNPRSDKFRGYRQRFYHKFNYFNKRFDEPLCVGCGRCIIHCPTKVDILEIALHVPGNIPEKKEEKHNQKIENRTKVC